MEGRCADARILEDDGSASAPTRPVGALGQYHVPLRVSSGARVRANPSWPGEDHRNVIGTAQPPSSVRGHGPLKGVTSNGLGYAVPVVDSAGERCRGYLSATVVEAALGRTATR